MVRPWHDQYVSRALAFFGAVYRRPPASIQTAVAAAGLAPVLHKRISTLSKGYARRMMWAFALLAPHPLLLMDEPFDGFDLRQTHQMTLLLRQIAADGRTFLLSIHQLTDAERACDRFVLLDSGRIRGAGSLQELREKSGEKDLRMFSSRLRESALQCRAPLWPLLIKELWGVIGATEPYGPCCSFCVPWWVTASFRPSHFIAKRVLRCRNRRHSQAVCRPLIEVLVPTWGAFYVGSRSPFPFVAIRVIGLEKESGALRVLIQMPYRVPSARCGQTCCRRRRLVTGKPSGSLYAGRVERVRRPPLYAGNAQPPLRTSVVWVAGRRNCAVCYRYLRWFGDCRDHHTCVHDRFLGPGLYGCRSPRATGVAVSVLVDPDAA